MGKSPQTLAEQLYGCSSDIATLEGFNKMNLDEPTMATFEELSQELERAKPSFSSAMAIISSRLPSDQILSFHNWERGGRDFYKTQPGWIIQSIQHTDFFNKASRKDLIKKVQTAFDAARYPFTESLVPSGSLGGYRYSFRPRDFLRNRLSEEESGDDFPRVPAAVAAKTNWVRWFENRAYFAIWERTYDDIWCPCLSEGIPQRQYGKRSGDGTHFPSSSSGVQKHETDHDTTPPRSLGAHKQGLIHDAPPPPYSEVQEQHSTEHAPSPLASKKSRSLLASLSALPLRPFRKPSHSRKEATNVDHSDQTFSNSVEIYAAAEKDTANLLPSIHDATSSTTEFDIVPIGRHAFLHLGPLYVSDKDIGKAELPGVDTTFTSSLTDFFVAVSIVDSSVWIFYDAWDPPEGDELFIGTREDEYNPRGPRYPRPTKGRFRPEQDSNWARLKGYGEDRVMAAKLTDNVKSWEALGSYNVPMTVRKAGIRDGCVPLFITVRKHQDGTIVGYE